MNPTRLRLWIRKYGDSGVLLAGGCLAGHHLWTRRRAALIAALALLTGGAILVLWARHLQPRRHNISPAVSASVSRASLDTALLAAVRHNDLAAASAALYAGANVHAADSDGDTALIIAAENAGEQVARLLLHYGADANANSAGDCSKALCNAVKRKHTGLVRLLLENKARIYSPNAEMRRWGPDNEAPDLLGYAASNGCDDILLLLLHHGAKADFYYDAPPRTALMDAAAKHHVNTVSLLLAHGADINWCDRFGTALTFAVQKGDFEMVKFLVAHGADVNVADGYGIVLEGAVGHPDILRFLLQHGAKVNKTGKWGTTALMIAARNNDVDCANILLSDGAEVDFVSDHQGTALKWAAQEGHTQVIRTLLRWGANVNLKTEQHDFNKELNVNTTTLQEARRAGHKDVVRLLKRAGARE